ncbi:MAG: hypothetical protein L3K06_00390 [Thermoplasmata archaeon]|nr:hypothetical protein [Thermoplasmata archaeon]
MAGPGSSAWVLHETFTEILRRLNQASERGGDAPELEYAELERATYPFWATHVGEVDLAYALELLLENGLVEPVHEPVYAWDRQRVIGERFRITTMGKSYLLRQIEESGRIR